MYATEAKVRSLIRNKMSPTTIGEIEAIGEIIDTDLDGRLSAHFDWPVAPIPDLIISIASLLTAAVFEHQVYAQNEADQAVANPYASRLERMANKMLDRIIDGDLLVALDGGGYLSRGARIASRHMELIHSPVVALRGSGRS